MESRAVRWLENWQTKTNQLEEWFEKLEPKPTTPNHLKPLPTSSNHSRFEGRFCCADGLFLLGISVKSCERPHFLWKYVRHIIKMTSLMIIFHLWWCGVYKFCCLVVDKRLDVKPGKTKTNPLSQTPKPKPTPTTWNQNQPFQTNSKPTTWQP